MNAASPLVSVILLSFNQRDTVREAALSCLAQQCAAPIEVLFSDDHSSDDSLRVLETVAAEYRGPHVVRVNGNPRNLGIAGHLNKLVELTRAPLIVVAAGDDIMLPERVAKTLAAWEKSEQRHDLMACHLYDLDEHGRCAGTIRVDDLSRWRSAADWLEKRPYVIGAGHAWTRRLFERFGPLADGIAYEDQVLTLRAVLSGGAMTIDEPLVRYRRGGTSSKGDVATPQALLQRMQVQNTRHLAELGQMQADATLAGAGEVSAALERDLQRQRYLQQLLEARDDWKKRLRALWSARGIPLGWRWRKFAGVAFPELAAWKQWMKSCFRRRPCSRPRRLW